MKNKELADLLYEIGDFLEIQDEQSRVGGSSTSTVSSM